MDDANSLFNLTIREKFVHLIHIILPWTAKLLKSNFVNPEAMKWFNNVANQAIDMRKQSGIKRNDIIPSLDGEEKSVD